MRLAGTNKGVEQPVPNLVREKLTIDEVSPKKTGSLQVKGKYTIETIER